MTAVTHKLETTAEERERWLLGCSEKIWLAPADLYRLLLDVRRLEAALASAVAGERKAEPDWCYRVDDWEATFEWSDRNDLADDLMLGEVLRVGVLHKAPDRFVAVVPVTFDEDGCPDERAIRWFRSEEEANAAANARATPTGGG